MNVRERLESHAAECRAARNAGCARPPLPQDVRDELAAMVSRGERAILVGAILDDAILVGARLVGARLDGARLVGASLVGAILDDAILDDAILDGAILDDAILDGARLDGARLVGASLDGAILGGARLDGARLVGASLVYAHLDGAILDDAILDGARLDGARLVGASLVGARLVGASLDGARLVGASLVGAILDGASLDGAILGGARLDGASLDGVIGYAGKGGPPETSEQRAELMQRRAERRLRIAQEFRAARPDVPVVANLDAAILAAVSQTGCALDMGSWHQCETTHCRAGWAITLAGEAGKALEDRVGPPAAGSLIYLASAGYVPNFYANNDEAMADMREAAGVRP